MEERCKPSHLTRQSREILSLNKENFRNKNIFSAEVIEDYKVNNAVY